MSVFVAVAAQTLLHLPLGKIPSLKNYLTELPVGMRLWGCYVLAHESYLKQEYEKSLGIIETCLTLTTKTYPIAMIYLNLMGAMDAMNLRKEDIAKKYFMEHPDIMEEVDAKVREFYIHPEGEDETETEANNTEKASEEE